MIQLNGRVGVILGAAAILFFAVAAHADVEPAETGPNISGESTGSEHRRLFKEDSIRKDDNMRIEVPRRPDGLPVKPVRGLSRTEKMDMDDLEYRFQMGLIGEAEYYSRRNAMMERIGLEPEI
jgi:hypothetical protein